METDFISNSFRGFFLLTAYKTFTAFTADISRVKYTTKINNILFYYRR